MFGWGRESGRIENKNNQILVGWGKKLNNGKNSFEFTLLLHKHFFNISLIFFNNIKIARDTLFIMKFYDRHI